LGHENIIGCDFLNGGAYKKRPAIRRAAPLPALPRQRGPSGGLIACGGWPVGHPQTCMGGYLNTRGARRGSIPPPHAQGLLLSQVGEGAETAPLGSGTPHTSSEKRYQAPHSPPKPHSCPYKPEHPIGVCGGGGRGGEARAHGGRGRWERWEVVGGGVPGTSLRMEGGCVFSERWGPLGSGHQGGTAGGSNSGLLPPAFGDEIGPGHGLPSGWWGGSTGTSLRIEGCPWEGMRGDYGNCICRSPNTSAFELCAGIRRIREKSEDDTCLVNAFES